MFVADRKASTSAGRSKKKVPKELLAAFKNTQKLPPPPYGRFPEGGYPKPLDPHLHDMQRRPPLNRPEARPEDKPKAPQIKVSAPPTDDILEDDFEKIAFEKKSKPVKESKEGKSEQPQSTEQPSKNKELPHIQDKVVQHTHNHLVQSVYYPEGTNPPPKEAPKHQKQGLSKQDLLIEKLYHTDRKAAGGYGRDSYRDLMADPRRDPYARSRSPEFYDPREQEDWGRGYPSKEQIYREFAQRHRTNTVPNLGPYKEEKVATQKPTGNPTKAPKPLQPNEFNEDLLYPETTKADRVIVNRGGDDRGRKQLRNISNKSAYPQMGSSSKVPPGYGGYYPAERMYDPYSRQPSSLYAGDRRYRDMPLYRDLYETARKPQYGYTSSYLDMGVRDAYRPYGRLY